MGGVNQPFLYEAEKRDSRYPEATFDPKAFTRASWESKPPKPRQDGPLLSFNRHPDAHEVLGGRRNYKPMSRMTKKWIVGMRVVQLLMRVVQLNGAIGILVLFILLNNIDPLTAWVMRLTAGVVMIHCVYGIYHLSRKAGARTPASSAAYQLFSAFADLCVLPLYTYGTLNVRSSGGDWSTVLSDATLVNILAPALYYTLIGAAGLHTLTLTTACWLSYMFRQITLMPPDMNPLEDHLTSRASAKHRRNKSSVATKSTYAESEKRLSTPLEDRRRSGRPYEDVGRPPSVPFAHTRTGSESSLRTRDSRFDLPSRQYQVTPGNSPRASLTPSGFSAMNGGNMNRMAVPPPPRHSGQSPQNPNRGSYMEIPLHDTKSPRHSTGTYASQVSVQPPSPGAMQQPRSAKFTEAWYTSDSMVDRTQQRNRAMNTMMLNATGARRNYAAVTQGRAGDDYDSDSDMEPYTGDENYDPADLGGLGIRPGTPHHPNPLASNPHPPLAPSAPPTPPPKPTPPRPKTPYHRSRPGTPGAARASPLAERDPNDRRVSGDIADHPHHHHHHHGGPPAPLSASKPPAAHAHTPSPASAPRRSATRAVRALSRDLSKRMTWAAGGGGGSGSAGPSPAAKQRDSSIQPEGAFFSKPYGELRCATPPMMQTVGGDRHVSSGNDYDLGGEGMKGDRPGGGAYARRNVSGKVAEEGRVNVREMVSRYRVLNEEA